MNEVVVGRNKSGTKKVSWIPGRVGLTRVWQCMTASGPFSLLTNRATVEGRDREVEGLKGIGWTFQRFVQQGVQP